MPADQTPKEIVGPTAFVTRSEDDSAAFTDGDDEPADQGLTAGNGGSTKVGANFALGGFRASNAAAEEQTMHRDDGGKAAILYRMVMPDHLCPYGLKAKDLLERQGYEVEDHHLETHEATEAFKKEHSVGTTPQAFIGGQRIGGYEDLREYFGREVKAEDATRYQPVIAIFSVALLMAFAMSWFMFGTVLTIRAFEWFIAISMCILAIQKLQDIESFSTMFLNYDLLARRWVRYGYIYPFGEALAGVLMIAGALIWIAAPVALFIGSVGAVSVFKAVYIDRRELKCACVGGASNVPLGFVSLTENLMMIAMALWMPFRMAWLG